MTYRLKQLSAPLLIAVYLLAAGFFAPSVLAGNTPDDRDAPAETRSTSTTNTNAPAPTSVAVAIESNGQDVDVTFTPHTVTGKPHFYEFKLYRSTRSSGTYKLVDTIGANASPADFDSQHKGFWYKAVGRNCTTAARTSSTCGTWSSLSSATAVKLPHLVALAPAPSGLRATRTTEDRVYLSWSSVSNASAYMVEKSLTREGPWSTSFNGLTRTNYIAYGLKCNTGYFFRIRANGDGTPYSTDYGKPSVGPYRAVTGACADKKPRVNPPNDIDQIGTKEKHKIKLDWGNVTGAVAYLTERSIDGNAPWSTVRFPATVSARNDSVGLECGTTYYYRVRSRGSGSTKSSVYGSPSSVFPASTAPCVPANSPGVEIFDVADSIEVGSSDAFYVSVTNIPRASSHTIRLTANEDAAFDSGCTLSRLLKNEFLGMKTA